MISKRVVVIGGGFAGSTVARHLEKEFEVTLIDTKNYFEFTPSILRTIVEPGHIRKIQRLHTSYLHRTHVVIGEVSNVSHLFVKIGSKKIPYDYLVIASGSRYTLPIKEQHVILATRAVHLRDCYKQLCTSESVLIIGGGLVGVELAAEIITKYPSKQVTLVHAGNRLIERNHTKASLAVEYFLKRRGVTIIANERIASSKRGKFFTSSGKVLSADMTFLCTGIIPNYEFLKSHFASILTPQNQIKVNSHLQVQNHPMIFAAGDIAGLNLEKTAQHAEHQARVVAQNIRSHALGESLSVYTPNKRAPMVISLGQKKGVLEYNGFVVTGYLPGLLKRFIEFKEMRKLR